MEIWGGIGRGTGDSSAACSGVCRTLARARRSLPFSFDPYSGLQLAPTSPKLVEGELCELPLYGVLRSLPNKQPLGIQG
jgi:hypothetical protein